MTAIDRFMEDVAHRIAPGLPGAARFEADLRRHLGERVEAGEDEAGAVARMGSPADVATGFLESVEPPIAAPRERLGAFLFDVGLGAAALTGVAALAAWLLSPRVAIAPAQPPTEIPLPVAIAIGAMAVLLFLAAILYFPVFETLFGQTAGKRLFGIVVGKDTGERAGAWAVIVRRIPFLFDIWPFDAAFLLFTARRQRAFDLAAGTIVFRAEGRHIRRPWVPLALVWGVAVGLGILVGWLTSGAPGSP
ncbi:MAG TPA: RDD family protein [Gemmatimonadota bacterium]|jgi:uncharacterized RDD family membrane protein YckC